MPEIAAISRFLFHLGTGCLVFGLSVLGILSVALPLVASEMYGLPASDPSATAWVSVAGLRDLGLAMAALALYLYEPRSLRAFVPTLLLIPIGDAILTLRLGGTVIGALTHLGGVFAISVLTACAFLNPDLDARAKAA